MFDFALLSLSVIALIISLVAISNNTKLELYEKREEILRFSNSLVSTLYKREQKNVKDDVYYFSRFMNVYSNVNGFEELRELMTIDVSDGLSYNDRLIFKSLSSNLKYKSSLAKNIIKNDNISFLLEDFNELISSIFEMRRYLNILSRINTTTQQTYEKVEKEHLDRIQNLEKKLDERVRLIKEERIIEKAMKNYLKIFTIK